MQAEKTDRAENKNFPCAGQLIITTLIQAVKLFLWMSQDYCFDLACFL